MTNKHPLNDHNKIQYEQSMHNLQYNSQDPATGAKGKTVGENKTTLFCDERNRDEE